MKAKQLETIRSRHSQYLRHGIKDKPENCECEIKKAILLDQPVKLRPLSEIVKRIKERTACERYGSFSLPDFFVPPKDGKVAEWEKYEADRLKRVAGYRAIADKVISDAELDDDSDAKEVAEKLREAAVKFGLYA